MNDDADADQRRARLRAMRKRYEQPLAERAESIPQANAPVAVGESRRARHRPDDPERAGGQEPAERSKGGGLLQRLSQFLLEPSPGDAPIAGTGIGERRLQQAVTWLEQRSRTTQGAAGERIQRLLRFLKQDIPGEPMRAGVNLKRLQQVLERAGTSPMPGPPVAEGVGAASAAPPQGAGTPPMPGLPVAGESRVVERDEPAAPAPSTDAEPAMTVGPVAPSTDVEPVTEPATAGEIAFLEETLARLRAVTQSLEQRLDEIGRQGATATGHAIEQRRGDPAAIRGAADAERPPSGLEPQAGSGLAPTAQARPESDDWFWQFLE